MIRIATVLLMSTVCTAIFAQTIDLNGTITDNKGKAISGAKVTLVKKKLNATSDSKGVYSILSKTAVTLPEMVIPSNDMISLKNNSIIVDLAKPSAVKIEMFDMKGKLIRRITDQVTGAGSFSFDLGTQSIHSAMVVRVTAGTAFSTFRYIPFKNDFQSVVTQSRIVTSVEKLAKVQAVIDSLTVSASGFITKTVPISSYEAKQDVSLEASNLKNFSFFVTSLKAIQELSGSENGFGGDLRFGKTGPGAGLLGADSICECIAERSMPGSKVKQWRAFLSAAKGPDGNVVHAIDRVGKGPWYDRLGRTVALTTTDLANTRPRNCDEDIVDDLPNEDGVPNHRPDPAKPQVDNHLTMTGSNDKGKLYNNSAASTCQDWTSKEGKGGKPRAGLSWPRAGFGGFGLTGEVGGAGGFMGMNSTWISDWDLAGCAAGICLVEKGGPLPGEDFVGSGGGYGGFYCFALNP